jgi:small subunit ribosomal protein S4e
MIVGGHNVGRVGVITSRERHPGSFDIVHVKDNVGHSFATRLSNVFVIGKVSAYARTFMALVQPNKIYISLPGTKGIRLTIAEERDRRLARKAAS